MSRDLGSRFRGDSVSLSLWPRLAISVPIVGVGAVLGRSLFISALNVEPAAALLIVIVGVYLLYALPLLRALWHPSESWRHEQICAYAASRRIEDLVRRHDTQ